MASDPLLATYHDREWGEPIRSDRGLFERMTLEVFQCGLSWKIVLVKRAALRRSFEGFRIDRVAAFSRRDVARLCRDAAIIRNRRKIEATVHNARRCRDIILSQGSLRRWISELPTETPVDLAATHALFRKTFRFMGPETTKCFLMGIGRIPPDHDPGCWRA
ncbi:MAG: DNA-3-methyladenine glycosylase I [Phycisphaerae bacterium]